MLSILVEWRRTAGLGLLPEHVQGVCAAVVLMTAYDDMPTVTAAMREGAFDFLVELYNRMPSRLARSASPRATAFFEGNAARRRLIAAVHGSPAGKH